MIVGLSMEGSIQRASPISLSFGRSLKVVSAEEWRRGTLLVLEISRGGRVLGSTAILDRWCRLLFDDGGIELGELIGTCSWSNGERRIHRFYMFWHRKLDELLGGILQVRSDVLESEHPDIGGSSGFSWGGVETIAFPLRDIAPRVGSQPSDLQPVSASSTPDSFSEVTVSTLTLESGPWRFSTPLLVMDEHGFLGDVVVERKNLCGINLGMEFRCFDDRGRILPTRYVAFGFPAEDDCRWRAVVIGSTAIPSDANSLHLVVKALQRWDESESGELRPVETLLDSEVTLGWSSL